MGSAATGRDGRRGGEGPGKAAVSVVVPVHNGGAAFRTCLEHLAAADPPPSEIVVVADGDSDGSWRLAEAFGARLVRLAAAVGPAAARNRGAREARGEVLLFVDADVAVHPGAVGRVIGAFRDDPGLAACFGSYDDEPAEPNFLSQYKNLQHHWVHQTGHEEASTFWSGCGAVRREVFLSVGGFDEGYRRPSTEDIELGYRLRAAGHRVGLVKDLRAKHLKRWEARSHLRAEFFGRALPWTDLILSRRTFVNDLNLRTSSRVSVAAAWLLAATLAAGALDPRLWALAPLWALALLWLNRGFYSFLRRKRGLGFVLKSLPWHWLYFLYCGLAFGVGLARHGLRRGRRPEALAEAGTGRPRGGR